jgi:hypothetical protein
MVDVKGSGNHSSLLQRGNNYGSKKIIEQAFSLKFVNTLGG